MSEIIPAILPKDFQDLEYSLARVRGVAPWVQIDVCDGALVPSKTWPYDAASAHWLEIRSEKEGLPYWEDFQFEVDLMVAEPLLVLDDWIKAGASRIIMQVGGKHSIQEVRAALAGRAEFAVAVSLDDDRAAIDPFIEETDTIQLMGISRVGFQGEHFDERVFALIQQYREAFPNNVLAVDGGVHLGNAKRLIEAGVTRLAVGSALFTTPDIRATYKKFQNIHNEL